MVRSRVTAVRQAKPVRTPRIAVRPIGALETLLLEWQATGAPQRLEDLVAVVRPLAETVAGETLRRHGIRDWFAVEEAVSLVLDHVRRLSGATPGDGRVARFEPRRGAVGDDPGRRYITCLARDRGRDVARSRRRLSRRARAFSQLDASDCVRLHDHRSASDSEAEPIDATLTALRVSLTALPSRERLLVELLLEGKSQAVIAHTLGVCEGTISRLRIRTIKTLRRLLAE